jgi:hypothetical protein
MHREIFELFQGTSRNSSISSIGTRLVLFDMGLELGNMGAEKVNW